MKVKTLLMVGTLSTLLTACVGSPAWYLKHQEKQIYVEGDYEIATVPMGENRFDAYVHRLTKDFDLIEMKRISLAAIEKRSGCPVVDSGFNPPHTIGIGYVLQAKVDCNK